MANPNVGQDVTNKSIRKYTVAHVVAKSYTLQQAEGMRRYGSLITSTPLMQKNAIFLLFFISILSSYFLNKKKKYFFLKLFTICIRNKNYAEKKVT